MRVAGSFDVATADAIFAQSDRVDIHAGTTGMVGLVAYTGIGPVPTCCAASHSRTQRSERPRGSAAAPSLEQMTAPTISRLEITK